MAIISVIGIRYLKPHIYVFEDFLIAFSRPLSDSPSSDFLHTSLFGFSVFLLYFNITIPTGLIASRFSIVCTKSGFKRNTIIRVLGLCITLTIIQAVGITFPFSEQASSDIKIDAIKKYNIESDILTESTAVLGRKISDLKFLPFFIVVPTYFTVNYFFIIYFVRKYKLYMNGHKDMISTQTQKINKEIMTILIVQAFTPVCLTGGPVVAIVIFVIIQKVHLISFFFNNSVHLLAFIPTVNGFLFTLLLPSNRKLIVSTLKKTMDTIKCKKSNLIK
uniref:G_PROTEIN_RECEP_F1_2 domain-containing protein n=1 Tax=Strongyloides papillosus TaxID=174720 RepID=A0A0N5BB42_STREA